MVALILTWNTYREWTGCSIHIFTDTWFLIVSFVFGDMLDYVVHHSMTKAFISSVTWVDRVVLLRLIQNASGHASSCNLLARAFFIFLLSTSNTLAIAMLHTTNWIDWLAANIQIISLATTTSILQDPTQWDVISDFICQWPHDSVL